MDKQAKEAKEQMKQLSFKEKWVNFWYYYKLHVVAALVVAFLVGFTVVECVNRIDYDLEISYYSASPISGEATDKLTELIKENVDDINANGQTDVFIASCFADPESLDEQTQATLMKLSAEIAAGETMLYLVDEVYYERLSLDAYDGAFEEFAEISTSQAVRDIFDLKDGEKLYMGIRAVYKKDKESKKDREKAAVHQNAKKALEYLKDMK